MGGTWHEDDSFWEAFAPWMFTRTQLDAAPREIDGVLELAQPPAGARVLDLACGPGRHTLELARRGYRVTGVDRTTAFLTQVRTQAQAERLTVELVEADMRAFLRPASFDLALSLFTSFGYFDDDAEDLQVATNLCESLAPGGALVMDLMGREVLARIFVARDWRELDDGSLALEHREIGPSWRSIVNRWILIRGGEVTERTLELRLYAATELVALLRNAGFATVTTYGDLHGSPYNHQAQRLVVVARKAEAADAHHP